MRDKLKKNDYIDRFGELQKVEHYMAHYKDGTVDILDEDWFTLNSEDEGTEYRITPSKWKHINKHLNEAHTLSTKDCGRIKKHYNKLRGFCDIKSLKRININDIKDDDKRLETAPHFERKKKETKWVMSHTYLPQSMNMKELIDLIVLIKYPRTGLN